MFYRDLQQFFGLTRREFRSLYKEMKTWNWFDRRSFIEDYVSQVRDVEDIDDMLDNFKWDDIDERTFLQYALSNGSTMHYQDFRPDKRYYIDEGYLNTDLYVAKILKEVPEFEEINRKIYGKTKLGRLSRAFTTLLKYAKPLHPKKLDNKMDIIWNEQKEYVKQLLLKNNGGEKYHTVSIETANKHLPRQTSAGYSWMGYKKGDVQQQAMNKAKWMLNIIKDDNKRMHLVPNTLAVRGHLSPIDEVKSRPIWIMPYESVLIEASLFLNVYRKLKLESSLMPYLTGHHSLSRFWKMMNSKQETLACLDISSWDAQRSRWAAEEIYDDIFKHVLLLKDQDEKVLDWVKYNFMNTRLCLPSGIVISKEFGMPSGSYTTLIWNSIANHLYQSSILRYIGIDYQDLSVLGDDNAFFTDHLTEDHLKLISELEMRFFGLQIHPGKVEIYTKISGRKFLGYEVRGLTFYRSTEEWFSSVLYPERKVTNLQVSFSRCFSYFIIGGINDQLYYKFFEYFIGTYYKNFKEEKKLFDARVFNIGYLRIFKHALDIDISEFFNIDIDTFLSKSFLLVPYFLTINTPLFLNKD